MPKCPEDTSARVSGQFSPRHFGTSALALLALQQKAAQTVHRLTIGKRPSRTLKVVTVTLGYGFGLPKVTINATIRCKTSTGNFHESSPGGWRSCLWSLVQTCIFCKVIVQMAFFDHATYHSHQKRGRAFQPLGQDSSALRSELSLGHFGTSADLSG